MLKKDFNKWPMIPIADDVLDRLEMHVTSLESLEDKLFWFAELPESSTEKKNKQLMGLDKQVFLSDNKQEPALDDIDVEQIRRKKAKAER